jgi:hypothetical protein
MADLPHVHPLQSWTAAFEQLPPTVRISVEPYVAMVDIRLGTSNDEVTAAVGVALPTAPNTWRPTGTGGRSGSGRTSGYSPPPRTRPRPWRRVSAPRLWQPAVQPRTSPLSGSYCG